MGESLQLRIIIRWQEMHSVQLRFVDHQAQYVIRNRMERLSKEDSHCSPGMTLGEYSRTRPSAEMLGYHAEAPFSGMVNRPWTSV